MGWAAIVLAGGRGARLGGVDKAALLVGGRSLLDRAVGACAGADPIVVVGPRRTTESMVRWEREEPPYGGPVAAVVAGLRAVPAEAELTAVLAADLPGLRRSTLDRLRTAVRENAADGALLVDATGRRQWLCGLWRTAALRAAITGDPTGRSMRSVLGTLTAVAVEALPGEARDVDTPSDLRALPE